MKGLAIGRVVRYVDSGRRQTERTAIITDVGLHIGTPGVNQVIDEFGDATTVSLAVFHPDGLTFLPAVRYGADRAERGKELPGTWHWPPHAG